MFQSFVSALTESTLIIRSRVGTLDMYQTGHITKFVSQPRRHSMHRDKSTLQARIEDKSDLGKVNASMLVVAERARRREVARSKAAPKRIRTIFANTRTVSSARVKLLVKSDLANGNNGLLD